MNNNLMLAALNHLRDWGPVDTTCGICFNLAKILRAWEVPISAIEVNKILSIKFEEMGRHSSYPVPGGSTKYDSYQRDHISMWDKSDPYGQARHQLLSDLIVHITNHAQPSAA